MRNFEFISGKYALVPWVSGIVFLFAMIGLVSVSRAENIISAGTTVKCLAGTSLVSVESLTIKSGATLDNAGTLILKKDLVNQNISPVSIGTGTVICSGTVPQALNGPSYMQNLTINNAAGVTNGGFNKVSGVLTLTSGLVILGANNLTLGTGATIAGAPSAIAMLVPTGSGKVFKEFPGIGSFTFPVGDNTGANEYTPVTIAFTGGSFSSANRVGVKLTNAAYPGSSGSYLNRYWDVEQTGITAFTCNATFKYMPADIVGTESSIYCVRVLPEPQTNFSAANTTLDQLSANGLTYFGTFTGKLPVSNKTLNLTLMLEGYFNGVTMNQTQGVDGSLNQYNNFPGSTVDTMSVYIASSTAPYGLLFGAHSLNIAPNGALSLIVPGGYTGSYYIAVFHRSSIQTWSSSPVSFAGSTINYNFTTSASQAYGSNQKDVRGDGTIWAIYSGDCSSSSGIQDGYVDFFDLNNIYNLNVVSAYGYQASDLTGDGFVDFFDLNLVYNNNINSVGMNTPPNPAKKSGFK